ncbi:[Fe-Fe] hydrogenase large subunit C-terminal domain-containing protein [Mycoplasmatota bacterium WC44]
MEYLNFQEANCQNCYKCIRTCKVKAIQLVNRQARIVPELCVGCGECLEICPQNAKQVKSDLDYVKELIASGVDITVSLAPSFPSYDNLDNPRKLITALKQLGFNQIEETSIGAVSVSNYYKNDYQSTRQHIITSSCPTVNFLIQKYYAKYTKYLSKSISPMMAHNALIKREDSTKKVVFIGPCISKKEETIIFKDELQRTDAVLTFDDLRIWFKEENIVPSEFEPTVFDKESSLLTKWYPLSGGVEKATIDNEKTRRVIRIDGMENVIEFLDNLEDLGNPTFIEMNACKNGCINGFGNSNSPISTNKKVENVIQYISSASENKNVYCHESLDVHFEYQTKELLENSFSGKQIRDVLEKTGKFKEEDELNCGTCGYDTCKEKAIAVLKGMAELEMCLPHMRDISEDLSSVIIENTPNGIILANRKYEIIEFNPSMASLLKISKKDVLNKYIGDVLKDNVFLDLIEANSSTYISKVELKHFDKVMIQSLKYIENQELYLGIFKDITEAERNKEKLKVRSKNALDMAQDVINKQMIVAHEIAHLLGETTAETKVTLSNLKKMFEENLTDE